MITIIDDDCGTLLVYPQYRLVHHYFKKAMTSENFRRFLTSGADAFIEHRCCKWLSDDRKNAGLSLDDTEWSRTKWAGRVVPAGWKYWAIVMPEKLKGKLDMERHIDWGSQINKARVQIQLFDKPEPAFDWLVQVDQQNE